MVRRAFHSAGIRCPRALAWCFAIAALVVPPISVAATVAEKAKESGCVGKAVAVTDVIYKCTTAAGIESYFNISNGGGGSGAVGSTSRRNDAKPATTSPPTSSTAGFPRVDPETQKGRDDLRRKVLTDELTAEEKALADARIAYDGGAPAPLPEEKADAEKYRQRIGRLREAVQLHQRNVEALKKELGTAR